MNYTGELAALFTAVFWTITALAFESASIKIGSLAVNIIRLVLAFIFLSLFNWIYRGLVFPVDASMHNWSWLLLSGLIGFVFGDLFLFKSYTIIGSRFAMLIMTTAPPITAFLGWIFLNEKLSAISTLGMIITILGIALAIFNRDGQNGKLRLKFSIKGILYAFGGAIGQAVGLILSKYGMGDYDAFASTQIRLMAGICGFAILVSILGRWKRIGQAITNKNGMLHTSVGSFFGPFLGVSFSLVAVKYTQTGIASTIMSIIPVLIIPPTIFIYKQKVTWPEFVGAVISVLGVSLFFMS